MVTCFFTISLRSVKSISLLPFSSGLFHIHLRWDLLKKNQVIAFNSNCWTLTSVRSLSFLTVIPNFPMQLSSGFYFSSLSLTYPTRIIRKLECVSSAWCTGEVSSRHTRSKIRVASIHCIVSMNFNFF